MLAIGIVVIAGAVIWIAGAGALLLLIAGLVGATFVLSAAFGCERQPGTQLDPAGRAMLWLGELAAAWSVFLFWMPLERWCMQRDFAGARVGETPVLLIHGYINNAGSMWRLWQALRNRGVDVHTLNLEPVYADIEAYVPLIESRVKAICALTGADRVTLVCHSMGGLAARAYLRHCQRTGLDAALCKVVTLGTPHHGTALARFEWSANGRQMVPGNPWLERLGADERGAWPCPMVSIYSLDDNVVVPQRTAHLDGARNVEVAGIGHISLPLSRRVIELVLPEVEGPSRTGP